MRVIIATGFGKLHFHEAARALADAGRLDVVFLTGWVPQERHASLVRLLGRILREKHLPTRLDARRISIPGVTVTPLAWAEMVGTMVALVQRCKLLPLDLSYGIEFRIVGWSSRKHMKSADVLLVRSGAGQSGAIRRARKNGLAVVTDQSIAHPAYMHEVLREEFKRFHLKVGYDPQADLWKLVLRDCDDADLLLVNSDFVKETFVGRGYPAEKIRVVYLGVRESFFHLKREYDIAGPVRILFTGNFDLRKGVRILLEAIRICRSNGLDTRLELIGNLGNGAPCLEASDSEFFTHTPFVPFEELSSAFSRSDLFVLPTFAEGSSRSAMEAAAAGLPVITTKSCGLPLEHESSAIYVPINDAQSLAQAILRVSLDHELRETLGRNAAKTVAENYTWADYGRRVRKVLDEAVATSGLTRR